MSMREDKFTDQVREAKFAYLDSYGNMHFTETVTDGMKRKKYKMLDISDQGYECHGGWPFINDNMQIVIKRTTNGLLECDDGDQYLTPGLVKIYESLEKV